MVNKKIKVLVVEDELIIADYMNECLQQFGYHVPAMCINYDEAVKALDIEMPDIVLLDITLRGAKSGIMLAEYINSSAKIPFVFITSHSDRATIDKAKQTKPYAYLIKPFNESDLYAAIETALVQFAERKTGGRTATEDEDPVLIKDGIFVKNKGKFIKIQLTDLLWAEADDNYVTLNTEGGRYVLKTTLKYLQDMLPGFFWRSHRSYLINLHHIKSFDAEEVTVGSSMLPISKTSFPDLLDKLKILQG
ncbi:MAG TPA: response regulator [Chitinophagaceae bacterium]|nr:response regulator [Chitinophagaceae bacterium]